MDCGAPCHVINDGLKDTICHTSLSLSLITCAKWVQVFMHTNAKGQPFIQMKQKTSRKGEIEKRRNQEDE